MLKSINYWTFDSGTKLAEAAKAAGEAGFEAIEPTLGAEGEITPTTDEASCRELGDVIRAAGLEVASLATGLFWETTYSSTDPDVRERAYDLTVACLDRASWLGAPVLLVVPGVVAHVGSNKVETGYSDALANAYEALRTLAYEAESRNVIIAVENVWNNFLVSPVEMREFIDRINSPWINVYFDVGNVLRYGIAQDWIETLGKRIIRVHLKDFQLGVGTKEGFCPLGEGDVDWPAVMASLASVDYDGPLTYEGPGDPADISRRIDQIMVPG